MDQQAGVTNGGLTAGAESVARQIAIRQTAKQRIDLDAAIGLAAEKTIRKSEPRSGTCAPGTLIRVVLEGSFPGTAFSVEAEDIYADLYRGRICSVAYLHALPSLRSDLGTLWVPGTRSTGS
jgi:hypothetical protein